MRRHVWFKLPNWPVEFAPMADGLDRVSDLRDRFFFLYGTPGGQDQVKFYASLAEQRANQPLDLEAKVDGLGVEVELPILVDAPAMYNRFFACMWGLERTQLVNKLSNTLLHDGQRFVLLSAPHASGKMSIFTLFAHRHPELNRNTDIMLFRGSSPNDAMLRAGLDICGRQSSLSEDQQHVILIRDAQRNYDDKAFWKALITDAPSWLPSNIRFIISASYTLEPGVESPIEFQSISTLGRTDFLLSDEESRAFLELPALGLPEKMMDGKDELAQLLVRECGGLIGALRVAVTSLSIAFRENPKPSESELIAYFLSYNYQDSLDRCFCRPAKPTSTEFSEFLTKCLALSPDAVPLDAKLAEDNRDCFVLLQQTGVLVRESEQLVRFSSPMAERFYYRRLVPGCARDHPKSLRELVTKVLGFLSASVLRASADGGSGFPDEVTFRQQLMRACTTNIGSEYSVCPELPRIFRTAANYQDERGGIVRFVNATQKWGLEFFVNDRIIQDYSSQFAPGGVFAALQVDDYAVVDLRGNRTGTVPEDVVLGEKLITVFFQMGDFSRCQVVFGSDGARCDINLRF